MKATVTPQQTVAITPAVQAPAITITMPFDPKMMIKGELENAIKKAQHKVEKELMSRYPSLDALPAIDNLKTLIAGLNYGSYRKGVVLFASANHAKTMYLDMPVTEKVVLDKPYCVRKLVNNKKDTKDYLLLIIGDQWARLYHGNTGKLNRIQCIAPADHTVPLEEEAAGDRKQRFLQRVDNNLALILQTYPFPVFVAGQEKYVEQFLHLSRHESHFVQVMHGRYGVLGIKKLQEVMQPHHDNWEPVKQKQLEQQLQRATEGKKLVSGVEEVMQKVKAGKGRLLVVEKNYRLQVEKLRRLAISGALKPTVTPFYIKDAMDEVIQAVLEAGGDVEFVQAGILPAGAQVALVM